MGLVFTKIENGDVFTRDFNPLTRNNQIDFPTTEEIAVIYGPNGTGKTSLIKVLSDTPNTKLEFVYDGTTYTSGANVFHVVNDQNNRNIISGETRDFFLGDNIQHEFELQDLLAEKRAAFISAVLSILKGYKITTTKHPLSDLIEDESLRGFVKNCANNKSKGDQYTNEQIVNMMTALGRATVPDYDQACLNYLVEDYSKKKPVIAQIEALAGETLAPNMHVREIEENTEAIAILSRFHKDQCIVCPCPLESRHSGRRKRQIAGQPSGRPYLDISPFSGERRAGTPPFGIPVYRRAARLPNLAYRFIRCPSAGQRSGGWDYHGASISRTIPL